MQFKLQASLFWFRECLKHSETCWQTSLRGNLLWIVQFDSQWGQGWTVSGMDRRWEVCGLSPRGRVIELTAVAIVIALAGCCFDPGLIAGSSRCFSIHMSVQLTSGSSFELKLMSQQSILCHQGATKRAQKNGGLAGNWLVNGFLALDVPPRRWPKMTNASWTHEPPPFSQGYTSVLAGTAWVKIARTRGHQEGAKKNKNGRGGRGCVEELAGRSGH